MAIDFPNSPSINDVHSDGLASWTWTGYAWKRIPDPGAKGEPGIQGPTGPTGLTGSQGDKGEPGNVLAKGVKGEEGDKVAGEKFKAEFLKTLADNKSKNPDRAQIEVDGPLSTDTPKKEKDTSQPKEVDVKAVSPYQTKNNISFPNHPKKG